jgi:hypothetical protein
MTARILLAGEPFEQAPSGTPSDDLLKEAGIWRDLEIKEAEALEEWRSEEAAVAATEPIDDEEANP